MTQILKVEAFPELDPNWQNSQRVKPSHNYSVRRETPSNDYYPTRREAPSNSQRRAQEPNLQNQRSYLSDRFEEADPTTCVAVICICSLVVLVQAIVECGGQYSDGCTDEFLYTVVVGVISFVLSLFCVFWAYCGERSFRQFSPVIAIFFFVWWGLGTSVSTFSEPFADAGNGYFGAWGAFIASFIMAGAASDRLGNFLGNALTRVLAGSIEAKLYSGIAIASLVMLAGVAVEASDYNSPTDGETFGVICAVISFFTVIIHTFMRLVCEGFTLQPGILGAFLSVWWLAGVSTLTFIDDAPFKYASNGFFAVWGAFILSVWLALEGVDGYGGVGWSNRHAPQPIGTQPR